MVDEATKRAKSADAQVIRWILIGFGIGLLLVLCFCGGCIGYAYVGRTFEPI